MLTIKERWFLIILVNLFISLNTFATIETKKTSNNPQTAAKVTTTSLPTTKVKAAAAGSSLKKPLDKANETPSPYGLSFMSAFNRNVESPPDQDAEVTNSTQLSFNYKIFNAEKKPKYVYSLVTTFSRSLYSSPKDDYETKWADLAIRLTQPGESFYFIDSYALMYTIAFPTSYSSADKKVMLTPAFRFIPKWNYGTTEFYSEGDINLKMVTYKTGASPLWTSANFIETGYKFHNLFKPSFTLMHTTQLNGDQEKVGVALNVTARIEKFVIQVSYIDKFGISESEDTWVPFEKQKTGVYELLLMGSF